MWRIQVIAAAALLVAAGCSSAQARPAVASQGEVRNQLTAAYVAYAQCARAHGLPNLPDPQVDDRGNDNYPPGSIPANGFPQSVLQDCQAAWNNVRRWRDQLDATPNRQPLTAAQVQAEIRVAQCIREHGFPDYPDPGPDGTTPGSPPPGFDKPNLSAAARAAIAACSSLRASDRRQGTAEAR
jgi:hypothetical protein